MNLQVNAVMICLLWAGAASALPGAPDETEALPDAVEALALQLGFVADHDRAIQSAGLDSATAGALTGVLVRLHACVIQSQSAAATVVAAAGNLAAADVYWAGNLQACGADVVRAVDALDDVLGRGVQNHRSLDLWPVLRYEPGSEDNVYEHDYVLLVDNGGDDAYYNNAGGSLLDIYRGAPGSGAVVEGPARGCESIPDLVPVEYKCVFASAAMLDRSGDDTYGRLEAPSADRDGACTADEIIRRFASGGAAVAGVGVLRDKGGDDAYLGKILSLGAGHAGGFGYLLDEGGDDSYLAIRNSMGAATVTGVGHLRDVAGNDTYAYYMPSPLDPAAGILEPGSGGVLDDQSRCNADKRHILGSGHVGGAGFFVDEAGDDHYTSPALAVGVGTVGGVGSFEDRGGKDVYEGAPGRADDTTVGPDVWNVGWFSDS